jgi:hypothetical protein
MSDFRFARTRYLPATELGMAAVPCNNTKTSSTFDATGANRLTLMVFFTRVAGTGNIDLAIDAYDPYKDDWVKINTATVSGATVTMTDCVFRKASGSASQKYEIRITDVLFGKMRIRLDAAVTAAGATDLLDVSAYLGYGA